jgi:hypothetical protein
MSSDPEIIDGPYARAVGDQNIFCPNTNDILQPDIIVVIAKTPQRLLARMAVDAVLSICTEPGVGTGAADMDILTLCDDDCPGLVAAAETCTIAVIDWI